MNTKLNFVYETPDLTNDNESRIINIIGIFKKTICIYFVLGKMFKSNKASYQGKTLIRTSVIFPVLFQPKGRPRWERTGTVPVCVARSVTKPWHLVAIRNTRANLTVIIRVTLLCLVPEVSKFSGRRLTGVYSGLSAEDLLYLLIGFISPLVLVNSIDCFDSVYNTNNIHF